MVCMFVAAFKSHYMRMTARERELGDMKTQLLINTTLSLETKPVT